MEQQTKTYPKLILSFSTLDYIEKSISKGFKWSAECSTHYVRIETNISAN